MNGKLNGLTATVVPRDCVHFLIIVGGASFADFPLIS